MTEDELARRAVELTAELATLQAHIVRVSAARRDTLTALSAAGWSDTRLAELLGISRQAVATLLRPRN